MENRANQLDVLLTLQDAQENEHVDDIHVAISIQVPKAASLTTLFAENDEEIIDVHGAISI